MSAKIRVLVADDTDIAREGMRRILALEDDIEVVGEAAAIHEAVHKTVELLPDILLLDLKWFGDEHAGIEAIQLLRREAPTVKVIAITVYQQLIEPARLAGAASAVTKDVPARQLVYEIRSLHAVPQREPVPQVSTSNTPPVEDLSGRELEVLKLMADGKTDREIAGALTIAESTAKNHVSSILAKLGVANRVGAVMAGVRRGLIRSETP